MVSLLLAMTAALGPTAGAAASPSPRTGVAPPGSAPPAAGSAFSRAPGTHLPHGAPPSPAASPSSSFSPAPAPASAPAPAPAPEEASPSAPGASAAAVPAPAGRAALTLPTATPPVAPPPLTPTGPSLLTPTGSPPVTPFATPSEGERPFAGRPAGEGRVRPGRPLSPQELAEAIAALEDEATPATPSASTSTSAAPFFPSSEPAPATRPHALGTRATEGLRRLSLGSGIALVGLGLAFLGARMRRAD
ncbi:hypothetical protein OG599_17315 [Streptomyces sp. NBC_01335]|uniref:hypothetical protein n=1 Tax=Streptomyces sp. NBC_01335 TaxID=2903828 RepID=UPI002E139F47|nr:hypothetical protein OG599_17315 [Streptomyces sp. NBC_01335]